jgi:hypothetical protein
LFVELKLSPGSIMSSDSVNDVGIDEPKVVALYEKTEVSPERWVPPQEWLERLVSEYAGQHDGEALPPGSDPDLVAHSILTLSEEESVKTMQNFLKSQRNDYTVDHKLLQRLSELVEGNEACGMERGEWSYETCKRAGIIHNWSPYAEVRAVTLPYDNPDEPCESFRAYILGFFWVIVVTAVNTCKRCRRKSCVGKR